MHASLLSFYESPRLPLIRNICDLSNALNSFYSSSFSGRGQGNSKKQAEHAAAVKALLELKKLDVLVWPSMYITPKLRLYPSFHPVPQPGQQNQSENALVLQAAQVRGNSTAEYYGHNRAHDIGVY
jgi:hypothetical protein